MSPLLPLLLKGDCLAYLARIPAESVDAIVTDPPYGLGFMGKAWDALPPGEDWARACLRVLKPGGHLLAFGGTRTWHRLAVAVEDAGFELRDSIAWLYGSGFPKSLDVSKAIDKAAGVEFSAAPASGVGFMNADGAGGYNVTANKLTREGETTPEAVEWQGWGTALKPAFEPVVVARKPLAKGMTVAANVLAYGTGALNIDAGRVAAGDASYAANASGDRGHAGTHGAGRDTDLKPGGGSAHDAGRWPANVMLDESQAAALDAQAPATGAAAKASGATRSGGYKSESMAGAFTGTEEAAPFYGDVGGASRFFYVAKAPKSERPLDADGVGHPTVKPLALMRQLVRLVTPLGGCVVDPFAGSGTTLEAAYLEGFESIGIELTPDYWPLIEARIARVLNG